MSKLIDCITFYDENLLTNLRIKLLYEIVDRFIICESKYDHSGKKKKINFQLSDKKFQSKVSHIIHPGPFPKYSDGWEKERIQREYIFTVLKNYKKNDIIMYSDSDEIPNPKILKNIQLKKKYIIMMQKMFCYKFSFYNPSDSPWPGTRICKLKDLKSFWHLRKKIWPKNINYGFWRIDKERSIQIEKQGGWHFQNFYKAKGVSKKHKIYPHIEFSNDTISSEKKIKQKIKNLEAVTYSQKLKKIKIKDFYPNFLLKEIKKKKFKFFQ